MSNGLVFCLRLYGAIDVVFETDSDLRVRFLNPEDIFVVFIIVLFVIRHLGYSKAKGRRI